MNALGMVLIGCVIQVTLFALAVAVLYAAAFRRDPERAVRTVLGGLVGVALLTVVCWSPWPNWSDALNRAIVRGNAPQAELSAASGNTVAPSSTANGGDARTVPPSVENVADTSMLRSLWSGLQQVWTADNVGPQPTTGWSWPAVTAAAFLVAAALGIVRLVIGLVSVTRLARGGTVVGDARLVELVDTLRAELGCKRSIALVECESLATAATVGWRGARILLPSGWRQWSTVELRAVLAHEIAHVGRGDFGAHLVAQVGLALHSYHPLVRWLAGRLRLEQELAADAAAARVAGGRQTYLTTLAELALAQPATRLAWPVQAFIPSRNMFLRRIEMLRDQKSVVARSATASLRERIVGWFAVAALCGVGLGVIGLRAPSAAQAEEQVAGTESAAKPAPAKPVKNDKAEYDFSYVPENTMALFAIRQAELAADPRLRPLAELLQENTRPALPSKLVEQAMLVLVAPDTDEQGRIRAGFSPEQIVIHTNESVDFEAYLKKSYPSLSTIQDGGRDLMVIGPHPSLMSFFAPNKQTLLGRGRSGLVQLLANPNAALPPKNAEKWQAEGKGPLLVVVQTGSLNKFLPPGPSNAVLSLLGPVLTGSEALIVTVETGQELKLVGRLVCKSPDEAKRAAETLNALVVIAQNAANTQRERIPPNSPDAAAAATAFKLIDQCLGSRKVTITDSDVQIEATLGKTDDVAKMIVESLAPAVRAARAAARRTQSTNNLKQIALAMHMYADKEKHFPPAVLLGPDGKTPYSWRVALLPFLGHEALYKQYRFDQPWDSAENRKVLEQTPIVYQHPLDESGSFSTSYFVLTGPDTAFSDVPGKGTSITEIRDGTSNTLLAVEAKRHTPWTKPEDIPYAADGPVPKLGGWSENGFNAALCDGSVRFMADTIDDRLLRGMITKAGGERIDNSKLR